MRLLLVEDSERFAALLKMGLGSSGFAVDIIATAEDAAAALKTTRWDIIVLDLGLPDADGLDLLADLRRRADTTPVLILSARGSLRDRIIGLEAGADDYLVKPFALEELVERLKALLRRPGHLLGRALKVGNLTLDTVARQVFVGEKPIVLSARELAVLEHLLRRSGKVVAKSLLEGALYGPTQEVGSNAVEVHVHRLRRHLVEVGASVRGQQDDSALLQGELGHRASKITEFEPLFLPGSVGQHRFRIVDHDVSTPCRRADVVNILVVHDRKQPRSHVRACLPEMPFGQTAHESVLDEIVDLSFIAHQCSGIAPEAGDFSFNALGKIIHPAFSNSFDRCIDRSDGVKASERHAKAIDHIITIRESA